MMEKTTLSQFLDGKLKIRQPVKGYRAGSDAVLLASFVQLKRNEVLVDVGTGVGTIALCVGTRFPHNPIYGIELQKDLCELAVNNALENKQTNTRFMHYDIVGEKTLPHALSWGGIDQVVTNPPYYDEKGHTASDDKARALARCEKQLSLKSWLKFCARLLKGRGTLTLILPTNRLDECILSLSHFQFGEITLSPLWSKAKGPCKRIIIKARKEVKGGVTLHPGLVLHHEEGAYTPLAQGILRDGKGFQV